MIRPLILVVFALLLAASNAQADYVLNLSVLDGLEAEDETADIALPAAEVPLSATTVKPVKKAPLKNLAKPKVKPAEPIKPKVSEVKPSVSPAEKVADKKIKIVHDPLKNVDMPVQQPPVAPSVVAKEPIAPKPIIADEKPLVPVIAEPVARLPEVKTSTDAKPAESDYVMLTFGEGSDVLDSKTITKLNDFSEAASSQNSPKILIEAYHYENGEKSFSRKRLSLNRAVTVRSYLLGKGHKSFSIKIINTEDAGLRNSTIVSY